MKLNTVLTHISMIISMPASIVGYAGIYVVLCAIDILVIFVGLCALYTDEVFNKEITNDDKEELVELLLLMNPFAFAINVYTASYNECKDCNILLKLVYIIMMTSVIIMLIYMYN